MPYLSRRQVELSNGLGLHLRAASRLVQLAQQFQSEVRVFCQGRTADGKSILDLLALAAQRGSRLEIETRGADADEAAAAILELIEARFQECEEPAHSSESSVSWLLGEPLR